MLDEKIPDFRGYDDEEHRRLSDEQVRSYLGEALAAARERLAPLAPAAQSALDDLVIRTGFTNQQAFRTFEDGARNTSDFGDIEAADAEIVQLADRAATIDAQAAAGYLSEVAFALDRRDDVMRSYAQRPPVSAG